MENYHGSPTLSSSGASGSLKYLGLLFTMSLLYEIVGFHLRCIGWRNSGGGEIGIELVGTWQSWPGCRGAGASIGAREATALWLK